MILGWIGTGVMGASMCKHLLKNGQKLLVFNRTQSKADEVVQNGGVFSPVKEIAEKCDIIFLMLGYPHDVEDMVFNQLLPNLREGQIVVDHTTSSPALAKKIYEKLLEKKVYSIDAPVSGGDVGAREGKLSVMCGGDKETFEKVKPIMGFYGTNIQLLGEAGKGQSCKMGNQICIANNMQGVVEALIYAYSSGLDLEQFVNVIKTGAAGSKSLEVLAPRMINGNFDPGFYVEHFVKDINIILQECDRMQLALPGLSLVKQFYNALMKRGGAKMGTQALILVLEDLNKISIRKTQ